MSHLLARKRPPMPVSQPTWEARSATEADMRWLCPRLPQATLDEIDALSKYRPISFLLQDMGRKRVVVDRGNPNRPVAVFDVKPAEGQDQAAVWVGLTVNASQSDWRWSLDDYCWALFNQMNKLYGTLYCHVDAGNVAQMQWLERGGFIHLKYLSHYGDKQIMFSVMRRQPANV